MRVRKKNEEIEVVAPNAVFPVSPLCSISLTANLSPKASPTAAGTSRGFGESPYERVVT